MQCMSGKDQPKYVWIIPGELLNRRLMDRLREISLPDVFLLLNVAGTRKSIISTFDDDCQ